MKRYYRIREFSPIWWLLNGALTTTIMVGLCLGVGLIETL